MGGANNSVYGYGAYGFIGGGQGSTLQEDAQYSSIGGESNNITGNSYYSTIAGG